MNESDNQRLAEIKQLLKDVTTMTLHGPLPLKTSMALATAGLELLAQVESLTAQLAAQAQGEPQGWQPMNTAPRDGTRILLAISGVDRAVLAYWNGAEWLTLDGHEWKGRTTTRWMPLPAPPELESLKEPEK